MGFLNVGDYAAGLRANKRGFFKACITTSGPPNPIRVASTATSVWRVPYLREGVPDPGAPAIREASSESSSFEKCIFRKCIFRKFANFLRARSRLYQNEILQENNSNMRLTAFFKLYKICILLHR